MKPSICTATTILALALALAACGSSSASDGQGGAGAGGAPGTGGGNDGGAGSGGQCDLGGPLLEVTVTAPDGEPLDGTTPVTIDGIARFEPGSASEAARLFVDVCLPSQDCTPTEWTIAFEADAEFTLPEGTFVRAIVRRGGALVRNLPTLDGLDNPTSDGSRLWMFSSGAEGLEALGEEADHGGVTPTEELTCQYVSNTHIEDWNRVTVTFADAGETLVLEPGSPASTIDVTSGPAAGRYAGRNADCGRRGVLDPFCSYTLQRLPAAQ